MDIIETSDFFAKNNANDCVHGFFAMQVKKTPEAIAVTMGSYHLTYSELNNRANKLASFLRLKGVQPNFLVGLAIERSINLIIGILGILKAGGACVPLDASYPQNRIEYMVKDAGLKIIITTEDLEHRLSYLVENDNASELFILDKLELDDIHEEEYQTELDSLIYILYTSGSTGNPKGVVMPHRCLTNLIKWQLSETTAVEALKTLQFSPISFDVSFQEIFSTLCAGGELILLSEEIRRDPQRLLNLIIEKEISRIFLPVIVLQQFAEVALKGSSPFSLRAIITAGEQLQITPTIRKFFAGLKTCSLYNHYGPTETHVVTSYRMPVQINLWTNLPSIGRPISNVIIYILDTELNEVLPGEPGELYLGGNCVAKGYLNRPELTSERFISNPFTEGYLYKTGDLVRYQPDGNIEFLERIDRQVKIRGFRVELAEIEITLKQHLSIKDSVVEVFEGFKGIKQLLAYIVLESNVCLFHEINFENSMKEWRRLPLQLELKLKEYLLKELPEYMIPSLFAVVPSIPITPNGKVDRNNLPTPPSVSTHFELPISPSIKDIEKIITAVWRELLQVDYISPVDNFFEIGGHSLLLMHIHQIFIEIFNFDFPITILFENSSIILLAKYFHNNKELNVQVKSSILSNRTIKLSSISERANHRRQARTKENIDG